VCVALSALGILFLSDIGYIQAAEHWTADWRTALFSKRKSSQDENVALVLFTEETLQDAPVRIPMDRHFIAKVIRAVASAEPSAIGIDFVFARPTNPEADGDVLSAIRDAKVPIVLVTVDQYAKLPEKQLQFHRKFLADAKRPTGHAYFERKTNVFGISDQAVRQMAEEGDLNSNQRAFAEVLAQFKRTNAKPHTAPIAWLLTPRDGSQPFLEVDAADLLGDNNSVAPYLAALKGKIVMIGSDLVDLDRHLTPLSVVDEARMPGVKIHAFIVSQLIDDRWIRKLRPAEELLLLLTIASSGYLVSRNFGIRRFTKTLAVAGSTVLVIGGFGAFKFAGLVLPYTTALTAWITSVSLGRHIDEFYERLDKVFRFFATKGRLSWRTIHRLGWIFVQRFLRG
jgi:CHASE2 domain-containing sensor protein